MRGTLLRGALIALSLAFSADETTADTYNDAQAAYETGDYETAARLFRVLAELRMSIGEFFDDLNREAFTPRDLQLMRHLRSMDEDSRREVEQFINFKTSRRLDIQGNFRKPA